MPSGPRTTAALSLRGTNMLKALLILVLVAPSIASAADSASGSVDVSTGFIASVGGEAGITEFSFSTATTWSRDLVFMAGNVEAFRINAEGNTFWINPDIKVDEVAQRMFDILRGLIEDGGLCQPAPIKKKVRRIER